MHETALHVYPKEFCHDLKLCDLGNDLHAVQGQRSGWHPPIFFSILDFIIPMKVVTCLLYIPCFLEHFLRFGWSTICGK